jgi:N-acetylated-alpha-linked acidic dipeptidase
MTITSRGSRSAICEHEPGGAHIQLLHLHSAVPSAESALAASRDYATHPHLAGAVEDFQDAKDILALFQSEFGIPTPAAEPIYSAGSPESRDATLSATSKLTKPAAWVDIYYPVMNTGNSEGMAVELLGERNELFWKADLLEDGDPLDDTASKYRDSVPPFHGLSASGEAIGQLVYANYGDKDDYDKLVKAGVNFTGKVVLTRYGANFRGLKVSLVVSSDATNHLFPTTRCKAQQSAGRLVS